MPQIKTYKTPEDAVVYAEGKYGLDISKTTKDISGQTFGKLFVIRHLGRGSNKRNYVLTQCTGVFCNNEYAVVNDRSLRSGNTTSCGCARFKVEEVSRKLKEQGFRVVSRPTAAPSDNRWSVECTKGHVFEVFPHNLISRASCCVECSGKVNEHTPESLADKINQHPDKRFLRFVGDFSGLKSTVEYECIKCKGKAVQTAGNIRSHMTSCPLCSTHGFRKDKPASLYLHKLTCTTGSVFYKVGITNNEVAKRVQQQVSKFDGNSKLLITRRFEDGAKCEALEKKIGLEIPLGFADKDLYPDGFTETFEEKYLIDVLKLITGELPSRIYP